MNRKILLRPVVFLMLFILGLYILGEKFYWQYSIWWFDMFLHFFGGFWEGIFFIWFFSEVPVPFLRRRITDLNLQTVALALVFVFFIGICWEAGEFLTWNYIGHDPFSLKDTLSDLIFDMLGGISAVWYAFRKISFPQR